MKRDKATAAGAVNNVKRRVVRVVVSGLCGGLKCLSNVNRATVIRELTALTAPTSTTQEVLPGVVTNYCSYLIIYANNKQSFILVNAFVF